MVPALLIFFACEQGANAWIKSALYLFADTTPNVRCQVGLLDNTLGGSVSSGLTLVIASSISIQASSLLPSTGHHIERQTLSQPWETATQRPHSLLTVLMPSALASQQLAKRLPLSAPFRVVFKSSMHSYYVWLPWDGSVSDVPTQHPQYRCDQSMDKMPHMQLGFSLVFTELRKTAEVNHIRDGQTHTQTFIWIEY